MTLLHVYLLVALVFSLLRLALLGFIDCVEGEEPDLFSTPGSAEVLKVVLAALLWPWFVVYKTSNLVTNLVISERRPPPRVGQ